MPSFDLGTFTTGSAIPPGFDPGRFTPPRREPTFELPLDVEKMRAGVKIPAFLPYYDLAQTAGETEGMRACYRQMLNDPTIKGGLYSKIFAVMAMNLVVRPPKRLKKDARSVEIAEFGEWALTDGLNCGLDGAIWNILIGGLVDGFSLNERCWGGIEQKGRWKGKRRLRDLKPKDVNQDFVTHIDEFKNVTGFQGLRYNAGEMYSPKDFVLFTNLGLFGNPTGMSDFRAIYSRYWILDAVWKLRAMACDKRAIPLLVGHWKDPTQRGNLETALARARFQNWISAPAEAQIEALNMAGQADSIFHETIADLREEIVIGIKGASLTQMTSSDERGDSKVHQHTSDLWEWQLATAILRLINNHEFGILPDVIDRNYTGVDEYPKAAVNEVNDEDLKNSLDIVKGMAETFDWQFNKDNLEEKFGIPWEENPELMVKKPAMAPMGGVGPDGMPMGGVGPDGQPLPGGEDGGAGDGGDVPTEDDFGSVMDELGADDTGEKLEKFAEELSIVTGKVKTLDESLESQERSQRRKKKKKQAARAAWLASKQEPAAATIDCFNEVDVDDLLWQPCT